LTEGQPEAAKFCRLDLAKLAMSRSEFKKMQDAGMIQSSSSHWASLLYMVKKKERSWWLCGDYRSLKLQNKEDKYPLPNLGNLAARLDVCPIFSTLDLQKGIKKFEVLNK
jgi:hypothetical protein